MLHLNHDERLNEGCRRILFELIDDSQDQLHGSQKELSEIIHEARKNFKKIRAVIKLLRYTLGRKLYKQDNYFFRDLGRDLSAARDADVNLETFEYIENHYSDRLDDVFVNTIKDYLQERRYHIQLYEIKTKGVLNQLADQLLQYKTELHDWPFIEHEFQAIEPGLLKTYKSGRKEFHKAYKKQKPKHFHEWRKEVKYHRYQLDLLSILWPGMFKQWEDEAHTLTDLLGMEHDIQVLHEVLIKAASEQDNINPGDVEWSGVKDDIVDSLRQKARPLGKRLYAEEPGQFIDRMEHYWKAAYETSPQSQS